MKRIIAAFLVFGAFGFGKVPPSHPGAANFPNVRRIPFDPPDVPRPPLPPGASPQGQRPHRPLRPLPKVPLNPGQVVMP